MTRRDTECGVALINVLMVMAISAALVQTMLVAQETAIFNAQKSADRVQASALAKGGVASLRSALRRDLVIGPDSDHPEEAWAQNAQQEVTFDFGSYSVKINDAQGRFDLNSLSSSAIAQQRVFSALLNSLDLPAELGSQITEIVSRKGPLTSLAQLGDDGVPRHVIKVLAPQVAVLPVAGSINLNTAPERVLSAVFGNAIVARSLSARRAAQGFLTRTDLSDLGVGQPALTGWRSDTYDIQATATVGEVKISYRRRVLRDPETGRVIDIPLN